MFRAARLPREFRRCSTEGLCVNWEAVTAVATAFTGCVIAVTALVGIYQLRQFREQRRDAAAIELWRSFQDTTFARAFLTILSLPGGAPVSELRAHGPEVEEAAQILEFRFETLGLLVYRNTISFDVVDDLIGGGILTVWHRLKAVINQTREEKNWPMYCEWFQWLAEQFEKRGRLQQIPAHLRLGDVGAARRETTSTMRSEP